MMAAATLHPCNVIPAQAGTHASCHWRDVERLRCAVVTSSSWRRISQKLAWVPACAGMTVVGMEARGSKSLRQADRKLVR
jgi:hypothetical protein